MQTRSAPRQGHCPDKSPRHAGFCHSRAANAALIDKNADRFRCKNKLSFCVQQIKPGVGRCGAPARADTQHSCPVEPPARPQARPPPPASQAPTGVPPAPWRRSPAWGGPPRPPGRVSPPPVGPRRPPQAPPPHLPTSGERGRHALRAWGEPALHGGAHRRSSGPIPLPAPLGRQPLKKRVVRIIDPVA